MVGHNLYRTATTIIVQFLITLPVLETSGVQEVENSEVHLKMEAISGEIHEKQNEDWWWYKRG